ncbi:MAG: FtsQ-type POTRA domain-containing protein [Clostridiales bacterium]|nr:FtsQ-type POTRA domain-containing protein [Clostridiales bacterium]
MARRRGSARRRRRGSGGFLYKLLSVLLICGCLVAAITLFFQVDTVVITGEKRYTEAEIREASGVEDGDNLFLLNKYQVIRNIADALPYIEIENTTIQRKLPDTLLIQVRECGDPLAWEQDGIVWLVSPAGKIVEQKTSTAGYPTIDGCRLLAPSVGTQIALDSEYEAQRQGLLNLLAALDEAGKLGEVDAVHVGDLAYISMDYMDRFTVKLDYDADFANKLQLLDLSISSGKIQDNMTGTFDMRYRADGRIYFQQNVRG